MANKLEKFTPIVKKQQKTILAHHLDKLEQEDFQ